MAILEQLGINSTAIIQFFFFVITLFVLAQVALVPYAKAFEQREHRTKGGEGLAQEILKQAQDLRAQYESKARQVSGDIKTIFDSYRGEASKEYELIVAQARAESQKLIEENRSKVNVEINEASKKLKDEVPQIAQAITQKLLAK